MFERGNEVTTNINQPIPVVHNSISVEEIICYAPKSGIRGKYYIMGKQLTDLEIDYAQGLLKSQLPHLNGLQSTLIQQKHALWLIKIKFK